MKQLFAVISIDPKGTEGLCLLNTPYGPQLAVTGDDRLLGMYLEAVKRGQRDGEVPAHLKIAVAQFSRTSTNIIFEEEQ